MGVGLAAAMAISVALQGLPFGGSLPSFIPVESPPVIGAESWLIYDDANDVMLARHNSTERRAIASVTKLMAALVAVEHASPEEAVEVSPRAAATGESEVGLAQGETWSMRELLAAMLVRSGNDAAVAIAEHIAESEAGFADLMNAKAGQLGMFDSHFVNPHGLDDPDHFATAENLLILAQAAMADPLLSRLMRTRVVKFKPAPDGALRRSANTNQLLGSFPGVVGMKTGFTNEAGRALVAAAQRGDRRIITVVLGSEAHFADTRTLLHYGFGTLGPPDVITAALVEEQGGGGTPIRVAFPEWRRVRLQAAPLLDAGRWAVTEPFSTPLGQTILDRLRSLLPGLVGGAT